MKIVTTGLTEEQRLEAVMKSAHVDEHRARAMLHGGGWDAVMLGGDVFVGESIYDAAPQRETDSAAVAAVVVDVGPQVAYGEIRSLGGTIVVSPAGGEPVFVRSRELIPVSDE